MLTNYCTPSPAILHTTSTTYLGGINCNINKYTTSTITKSAALRLLGACSRCRLAVTGLLAAAAVVSSAAAIEAPQEAETLSNIPQTLSGECASPKDCKKARIQRPKSRKAESCTIKCVTTCIRGGDGSPGEGPFNVRSLVECSDICNLIGDGDDGP